MGEGCLLSARCQTDVQRTVVALAATVSGSTLFVSLSDLGLGVAPRLFAFSLPEGRLLWQRSDLPAVHALALSPDGVTLALGLSGVPDSAAATWMIDARSGRQTGSIRSSERLRFFPTETKALAFSPDGSTLFGLTDDGLFAWDLPGSKLLWHMDVPGGDPKVRFDTAETFALSADGSKLALNRFGTMYVLPASRDTTAGRVAPAG